MGSFIKIVLKRQTGGHPKMPPVWGLVEDSEMWFEDRHVCCLQQALQMALDRTVAWSALALLQQPEQ